MSMIGSIQIVVAWLSRRALHFPTILDSQLSISRNTFNLSKVPLLVAKRTHRSSFQPTLNAIQMKDMTTVSKGNRKSIVVRRRWIRLIFNRRFIQRVSANSALEVAITQQRDGNTREYTRLAHVDGIVFFIRHSDTLS